MNKLMRGSNRRAVRILLVGVLLFAWLGTAVPTARAYGGCMDFDHQGGAAKGRICMPVRWNGDLVVFAHGYMAPEPYRDIEIPEDQLELPDGTSLPAIITGLGYAFATTSYTKNGLAVQEGIASLLDLVGVFEGKHGSPGHVYLVGASEGGLITALSVERYPEVYAGGLSTCGPVGDFRRQVNYLGDTRVLFDYFFPNILPPSPMDIPTEVMDTWDSVYEGAIAGALSANPTATAQLIRTARVPVDLANPDSSVEAAVGVLWYNVFATNDGIDQLGGNPFGNGRRFYWGSRNDWRLNRLVQRFVADPAALAAINDPEKGYQTSGQLSVPLVTMHNLGDPVVPYWHEPLYRAKIMAAGASHLHINIPSARYGHCNFSAQGALAAFAILVYRVTLQDLVGVETVVPSADGLQEYRELIQTYR